ncbi:g5537 [Coccomyxa viridis]|uniref:G5537 protein n=1 Tax=Coccomyxa viridis TaxID=1274662 RepID=A0ABP1FXZ9_9CHLO
MPPEGNAVPKRAAQDLVKTWCPPDVWPILEALMGCMKITNPDHILDQVLSENKKHPKVVLTELFDGAMEELYCAIDSNNAVMCPALVRSAARHVESKIQIWTFEADEARRSFFQIIHLFTGCLGLNPNELSSGVRSAMQNISTRVGPGSRDRLYWNKICVQASGALQSVHLHGQSAARRFWLLKAVSQLADLHLNHAGNAAVFKAEDALLPGVSQRLLDTHAAQQLNPFDPSELAKQVESFERTIHAVRVAVLRQAKAARRQGKSLRAFLTELVEHSGHGGEAEQNDVDHLIAILADRVGMEMQEIMTSQGVSSEAEDTADMDFVMNAAFKIPVTMNNAAYAAVRRLFPGFPSPESVPGITAQESARAAMLVKQQIQATRMHISMCIKAILCSPGAAGDYHLNLLDRLTRIYAEKPASAPIVKAINQALPGVWMCLLRAHKWPQGLEKGSKWLSQAIRLISDITAQHVRDADKQDISPEDHIRKVAAVPGLQDAEANRLVGIFQDLWAAQKEEADPSGPAARVPPKIIYATFKTAPADTSTDGEKHAAKGSTADGGGSAAVFGEVNLQSTDRAADVATDVAQGTSSKKHDTQGGPSMPDQQHEAAKP